VTSTQDEARALVARGDSEVVVVADEQRTGRGRHGRGWVSPPGNLYASVVTRPPFEQALWPAASLIAADALAGTLAGRLPHGPPVAVKWPNDVLLDGRKLAGLLLEVAAPALIIGFGLNLRFAPADLPETTTLAEHGVHVAAPEVLAAWLARWREAVAELAAGDRESWRARWLDRAAGLHRPVRVKLADRVLEGVHRGVDAQGALRVETPAGIETVFAGDVELVRLGETL
jgi:BirA family biotin operon repressor/biotin-[acetyl-CoA-carboxylase] ligase